MTTTCKLKNIEITCFTKYTYDSLGRKIKLKDTDLGTWTYTYDLAGNLISQVGGGGNLVTGDSYYREYNGLGQLQSVKEGNTSSGRILEEYFYDSNGDRIRVNRYSYSGGTNETIYTPYKEWMQIRNSSGTFNFYYIYQDGVLVARLNPDGTKWFYHPDHLGSTTLITDEQGNKIEDEFYSPFGESLATNNAEEFKLYTGQFKDAIDCQYYYGARFYNPCDGRFIQADLTIPDVYNPQAYNRYAYVYNNPYKYTDPDGENPFVVAGLVGYGIGVFSYAWKHPLTDYSPRGIATYTGKMVGHGAITAGSAMVTVATYVTPQGRIAKMSGTAKWAQAGKLFGIGATEYSLHQAVDGGGIDIGDTIISGGLNALPIRIPYLKPGTRVSPTNPLALNTLKLTGRYTASNLISSSLFDPFSNLKDIIFNTITGSTGMRLSQTGTHFNYVTSGGGTYPTTNPYWSPGTGNKAGTGYGGGGGPSNAIPDPSGRSDRYGNPVYIFPD